MRSQREGRLRSSATRSLFCALVIILAAGQAVNAGYKDPNYPDDPSELLQMKWNAVVSVLQNKDIDPNTKAKEVDKIVSPIFNFKLMSKLVLSKKNRSKTTPPQLEKFTQLFGEMLRTAYRKKIMSYTDEKAIFKSAVHKKKSVQILMELISEGSKIAIQYRLRKAEEAIKVKVDKGWEAKKVRRWKIYDVEIQGVSIVRTYQAQFDDFLGNKTFEDLLRRLEKPPAK